MSRRYRPTEEEEQDINDAVLGYPTEEDEPPRAATPRIEPPLKPNRWGGRERLIRAFPPGEIKSA